MESRARDWLKQAANDLEWARDSFKNGHWAQVCFVCQQIAEKALKAIALSRGALEIRFAEAFISRAAGEIHDGG